jgi:TonB family protein
VVPLGAALPGPSGAPDKTLTTIASGVNGRLVKIKACYETELASNPALAGQVVIHWTIDPSGHVPGADVESNSTGNAALAECMRGVISGWSFPPPDGGPVEVSFPFVFQVANPRAVAPAPK